MRECVDEGILQSYFDGELSSKLAESVASHLISCTACAQAASELESESLLLAEALEPEFAMSVPSERLRQRVDAAIAGLQVKAERTSVVATPGIAVGRSWIQSIAELFTLSPQRAFGYAGLAAVILLATVIGGIYWKQAGNGTQNIPTIAIGGSDNRATPSTVPIAAASPDPAQVSTPLKQSPSIGPFAINKNSGAANKNSAPSNQRVAATRVKLLPGERSYLKTIASLDATMKAESNRQMKASLQVEYQRNLAMVDQAIAATRNAAKVNPNDPDAADFMFAAYQSKIDLLSQVADSRLSNRQH